MVQTGLGFGAQGQAQNGSAFDLGTQIQDLDANLSQSIIGDGLGSALGLQNFVGFQTQMIFTIYGASANSQAIGVSLVDGLGRPTPGGGTILSAGSNIGLTQFRRAVICFTSVIAGRRSRTGFLHRLGLPHASGRTDGRKSLRSTGQPAPTRGFFLLPGTIPDGAVTVLRISPSYIVKVCTAHPVSSVR